MISKVVAGLLVSDIGQGVEDHEYAAWIQQFSSLRQESSFVLLVQSRIHRD
jgi:hypothetical protein